MRPSIVSASLNEPYPGWVDNFNGNHKYQDFNNNFNYYYQYHDDHKNQNNQSLNEPYRMGRRLS